jgi:hypothetical protein
MDQVGVDWRESVVAEQWWMQMNRRKGSRAPVEPQDVMMPYHARGSGLDPLMGPIQGIRATAYQKSSGLMPSQGPLVGRTGASLSYAYDAMRPTRVPVSGLWNHTSLFLPSTLVHPEWRCLTRRTSSSPIAGITAIRSTYPRNAVTHITTTKPRSHHTKRDDSAPAKTMQARMHMH